MNKVEDFINATKLNDLLNKKEDLINMTKLNELLNKKEAEEKKTSKVVWIFAIIGIIAAVAAAVYGVYRFFTPDYLEDFEDDFEDDYEDDFFEDEEDEEEPPQQGREAAADAGQRPCDDTTQHHLLRPEAVHQNARYGIHDGVTDQEYVDDPRVLEVFDAEMGQDFGFEDRQQLAVEVVADDCDENRRHNIPTTLVRVLK